MDMKHRAEKAEADNEKLKDVHRHYSYELNRGNELEARVIALEAKYPCSDTETDCTEIKWCDLVLQNADLKCKVKELEAKQVINQSELTS